MSLTYKSVIPWTYVLCLYCLRRHQGLTSYILHMYPETFIHLNLPAGATSTEKWKATKQQSGSKMFYFSTKQQATLTVTPAGISDNVQNGFGVAPPHRKFSSFSHSNSRSLFFGNAAHETSQSTSPNEYLQSWTIIQQQSTIVTQYQLRLHRRNRWTSSREYDRNWFALVSTWIDFYNRDWLISWFGINRTFSRDKAQRSLNSAIPEDSI